MNITLGESVAFLTVIVSLLSLVIGLPLTIYSVKKQVAEARNFLSTTADNYSKAASQAVDSQANLQTQIDELREKLAERDELINNLQKEIGKRDSKILDQDAQIKKQAQEIAELQSEVEKLRNK